jgi:vancomycin aglycone glucosyltransferase
MRVLLSTIGSRGDVQPLVALGLELTRAGHQARLLVPPDFREWIESWGLEVTSIGPPVRTAAMTDRRRMAEETVAAQFEAVTSAAAGCDAILAATALQIAAHSVAERMRVPYVFAAYCPNILPSPHHAPPPLPLVPGQPDAAANATNDELWQRDAARFDDLFGAALNAHRGAIGLAPVASARRHVFGDEPWVAADPTLGPWPDPADTRVYQPGAWILADERPLAPEVAAFLDGGDAPIYFGFGSTRAPQDVARVVVDTARALGRRAIISRGWADLSMVDDAPDFLLAGEVNLQALFRRVAAVVHHGGAGTTTLAAQAGTPQVIVPQIYDQHYWAGRIEELGVGAAHAPGVPTVESLRRALEFALRPEAARRVQSIAAAVRTDGAQRAVSRLLTLTTVTHGS